MPYANLPNPSLLPSHAAGSARRRTPKPAMWALVAACLALLVGLAWPMLSSQVYVGDDLGVFHLPLRGFYAQQLAAEQSFDWWPQLYGGMYITGEGQVGGYHPLHLWLYKTFSLSTAFNLEVFLSYPAMLLGMFFWLRRILGRSLPALFGALAFTFSGFNLLHLFHVNAIAVVAHIPWLLLAIDYLVRGETRRQTAWAWTAIAMLTGSQVLLGYPQYVWFSLLAEIAVAGYLLTVGGSQASHRDIQNSNSQLRRRVLPLASAKAVGLLLGGLQLLPTYDALQHSVRHVADVGFAESYSLHPLNLIQLIAPYLFETRVVGQNTHALGLYAGAVPLMLIVYLICQRKRLGRLKPIAIVAACCSVLALWIAFGRYGYLYRVQTWLPIVGSFRAPCRMILLFHLSTAVLSAIAICHMARLRRRDFRSRAMSHRPLLAVVAASVALVFVANLAWPARVASWPLMAAGPALLAIAAVLVFFAARNSRFALTALVLFCAADLGVYGLSYSVWPHSAPLDDFIATADTPGDAYAAALSDAQTQPSASSRAPFRVAIPVVTADGQSRRGNVITLAGYDRVLGYAGLQPQRLLDYRDPRTLRLAGVSWVHRDLMPGTDRSSKRFVAPPFEPLPRFRFVTRTQVSHDPARDLKHVDPAAVALVDNPLALPFVEPGTIRVVADSPGEIRLSTNTLSRQLLATTESYHAGWQMFVDGQPAATSRVNGDFLGGLIPAGKHEVVLRFEPASLRYGALASTTGLGLLATCFLLLRFRRNTASTRIPAKHNQSITPTPTT